MVILPFRLMSPRRQVQLRRLELARFRRAHIPPAAGTSPLAHIHPVVGMSPLAHIPPQALVQFYTPVHHRFPLAHAHPKAALVRFYTPAAVACPSEHSHPRAGLVRFYTPGAAKCPLEHTHPTPLVRSDTPVADRSQLAHTLRWVDLGRFHRLEVAETQVTEAPQTAAWVVGDKTLEVADHSLGRLHPVSIPPRWCLRKGPGACDIWHNKK
jgi:hypothetical protein